MVTKTIKWTMKGIQHTKLITEYDTQNLITVLYITCKSFNKIKKIKVYNYIYRYNYRPLSYIDISTFY